MELLGKRMAEIKQLTDRAEALKNSFNHAEITKLFQRIEHVQQCYNMGFTTSAESYEQIKELTDAIGKRIIF